jgi:hypothetical protein
MNSSILASGPPFAIPALSGRGNGEGEANSNHAVAGGGDTAKQHFLPNCPPRELGAVRPKPTRFLQRANKRSGMNGYAGHGGRRGATSRDTLIDGKKRVVISILQELSDEWSTRRRRHEGKERHHLCRALVYVLVVIETGARLRRRLVLPVYAQPGVCHIQF